MPVGGSGLNQQSNHHSIFSREVASEMSELHVEAGEILIQAGQKGVDDRL
jgi:hypothetical protein